MKLNTWTRIKYGVKVKEWGYRSPQGKANLLLIDHKRQPHVIKSLKGKRYVARLEVKGKRGTKSEYLGFHSQRSAEIGVGLIKARLAPRLLRKVR